MGQLTENISHIFELDGVQFVGVRRGVLWHYEHLEAVGRPLPLGPDDLEVLIRSVGAVLDLVGRSVRVLVDKVTLVAERHDDEIVVVGVVTGHPVGKSLRRVLRRCSAGRRRRGPGRRTTT